MFLNLSARYAKLLAAAISLLGATATLLAFVTLERAESGRVRERFHADVSAIVASFERELRLSFETLHGFGSAFMANPVADASLFAEIAAPVLQRQPVLRALAWAAWDQKAQQFEAQRCFALPTDSPRPCRLTQSERQDWLSALTAAQENLDIRISSAYPLTLDDANVQAHKRILAFLPVTAMAADDRLLGVVSGELMVGDLLAHSLLVAGVQDMQVALIDESAPIEARAIFRYDDSSASDANGPKYRYTMALANIGGRDWRIEARPTAAYVSARRSNLAKFALASGAIFSALVYVFALSLLSRTRTVETLVAQRTAELDEANRRLDQLARIDTLTGLPNRRAFDETLSKEFKRSIRDNASLALLMLDVDYFKRYNDSYGHVAGDACLRAVAEAIAGTFKRAGDFASRYGGEEFAIVLPATDERVLGAAERCLANIRELAIVHAASDVGPHVTASIGVCVVKPKANSDMSMQALVEAADAALYRAKQQGRNRAELASI